ncbi:chromate efflux transporter [Roseomonas sp. PWR1]|uniref:Chromate efflux transporter n=1 Tax=Roseomonas nitratireducens TaxID=2820810 RepID=A0ABS4ASE3_9PROT|nr:chromate efflux transporter [Neoroseomonas nitratireducens]MBP0464266.1 chromate efflux transporter [Neoroseomonas nitratireducens]
MTETSPPAAAQRDGFATILMIFLRLGLTSFGGPVAHIGYLREEFVTRRKWMTEQSYADLVALAQFMPGPASSQTGFAIGVMRGGLPGGLAAWLGFTMPSAIVMVLAAYGVDLAAGGTGAGVVHGLKLVAVAVVAQAVWGMAGSLCPDRTRATLAVAGTIALMLLPSAWTQIGVILAGAGVGVALLRDGAPATETRLGFTVPAWAGAVALLLALGILLGLPLVAVGGPQALALFEASYRAGALVFGGGHVVLPLLEASFVPEWMSADTFLAGYGVAQAVPGPLFTFAAFLGAAASPFPNGVLGGAIALVGIFLPGLLLMYGMLPFWDGFRTRPLAQAMLRGVNAAVVGILLAALYDPIFTAGVKAPADFAIVLAAFAALVLWKLPAWAVVAATAVAGVLAHGL